MILFDARHLWQILELGLLQPLATDEINNNNGFFPFAVQAVTVDGEQYAIPYFADVLHLVYRQNEVSTPPATWQALLDTDQRFVFPGTGQDGVSDLWLLSSYLSAGGQIGESITETDRQALEAMLTFLAEGKARGVIPVQVTTLAGYNALWSTIFTEEIEMASMSAHGFLRYVSDVEDFGFAALPGHTGNSPMLAQVWAFAVLAKEEQRRILTTALLDSFLVPAAQGQWSMAAHRLPTREDSWQAWGANTSYRQFLNQQLQSAAALPATQQATDFIRQLQQAQNGILTGQQTLQQIVADFR
jgi:ABC-type glycerol-3-phosphate transport system substrate-binding protein